MATGVNVSKTQAEVVFHAPYMSASKVVAYVITKDLRTRVTQTAQASIIESDSEVRVTQLTQGSVINSNSVLRITQVTLALVYPSDQIPPDEWEEPYPCTVCIERKSNECESFTRETDEICCLTKYDTEAACLIRYTTEYPCLTRVVDSCTTIERHCEADTA